MTLIFCESYTICFFSKMDVRGTKWSLFYKNVEKVVSQNHENCVLLRENAFCEKWQSGRINFFWGGFPTFMVYALPLITNLYSYVHRYWLFANIYARMSRVIRFHTKIKSNIYIGCTKFSVLYTTENRCRKKLSVFLFFSGGSTSSFLKNC